MEPLLFLAHRLPFPPNKGDKVRSFHFLEHLATRHRVFLGTFIDDPEDWQHVASLEAICAGVHVEALTPWSSRIRSLAGLGCGEAMTLRYFRSRRLHDWVDATARREKVARAFAFSSPMAQYVLGNPQLRCVVDMVDMDSAKWSEYARRRRWPISALFEREGERLLAYEREIAARAEASIFVTQDEARLFCDAAPESAQRVAVIGNGVDSGYFTPSSEIASPFAPGERAIVFTGAMDYWPNVDAVVWFKREVLPLIRRRDQTARFYIVGMNPAAAVRGLADDAAVTVTGRVADVRPFLQHAAVVIAPLRIARGIQNKVLEAMAMARPVVVTLPVAAGLAAREGVDFEVAEDAQGFAEKVLGLLDDPQRASRIGALARTQVLREYTWLTHYTLLDDLLQRGGAPSMPAGRAMPGSVPCAMAAN